jgi:ABC-type antimicrobial peptide transport system permease subunit
MRPALIGLAIGLTTATAGTRVMASLLYGVDTDDPLTIAVVALMLFGVAGLACFLPAWRITKNDPMKALRYE